LHARFLREIVFPIGETFFDGVADRSGKYLDVAALGKDLALLQSKGAKAERLATTRFAHYEIVPPKPTTFEDLDQALDTVVKLVGKYNELLGSGVWSVEPEFDALYPGWSDVFKIPWRK
jgi:hypothetical protein